jgi:putative PIN family toxin of toxin-antitoxin system
MLRVVLDTNILISAIINNGKPRKLFQQGIDGRYKILISKETLHELSEVLQRPKFKTNKEDIIRIISALMKSGENILITSNFKIIKNDPDDDVMINLAYDGHANYLVSGDTDLQNLKNFHDIKIVSVDKMLEIVG